MSWAGIEQDCVFVEFWELGGSDSGEGNSILPMGMEGGVGETFSFVLSKKSGVTETDVVDFIPGTPPVEPVPLFPGNLTFPA